MNTNIHLETYRTPPYFCCDGCGAYYTQDAAEWSDSCLECGETISGTYRAPDPYDPWESPAYTLRQVRKRFGQGPGFHEVTA